MKEFFKTSWNIIKVMLIHTLAGMPYLIGVIFLSGIVLFIQGEMDNLESLTEAIMVTHIPISMIVSAVVAFFIYKKMLKKKKRDIFEVCRFNKLSWDKVMVSLAAGMAFVFLSTIVVNLLSMLATETVENHEGFMDGIMQGSTILLFLTIGIVAPLIEEIMFRGIIFDELEKKLSLKLTILLQGLLFGLFHMNLVQGAYASVMGIFLGLSLIWTGSIWAPILIHLGNNLFSLALSVTPLGSLAEQNPYVMVALLIIAVFVVLPLTFGYLYKNRVNFTPRTTPHEPYETNPVIGSEELIRQEDEKRRAKKKRKKITIITITSIFAILLIFIMSTRYYLTIIGTGESSMYPTIEKNDTVIGFRHPSIIGPKIKHGSIVLFQSEYILNVSFVKRVIGMPGDEIRIEDGKVFVNGEELIEEYIEESIETLAQLTFPHRSHWIVPEGEVFVLGDNRQKEASVDSRHIGTIKKSDISWIIIYTP